MFPDVSEVLDEWSDQIKFRVLTKSIVDFETVETPSSDVTFFGILEPLSPQLLAIKPEGQREHKFWTLWTIQQLSLDTKIIDSDNKVFRVMNVRDWNRGGYYEYELMEDEGHS